MEPVLDLKLDLPPRGSRQLLRSLHRQLRAAIVDGRLRNGLRLPSTRELAAAYGISRNSAVAAYDLLLAEGYIATRPGGGTFVAPTGARRSARRAAPSPAAPAHDRRLNPLWRDATVWYGGELANFRYDFAVGLPDKSLFPFDVWRRLSARSLRVLSKTPAFYAPPAGRSALREAIAKHVSFARAVACEPDDVIVTSGAQQAFDLLARVLVTPGRTRVACENPGYPPMWRAFAAAGARLAPTPLDDEGLIVERLPRDVRVVCVTPSHQFPLGMTMSPRRRQALLEFAHRQGAVIIEDDYDGEFRHGGTPLDALQTLDRQQSVFYVGTFSKSLFPALRLGFIVAPPWARAALAAARQASEWHGAVLAQDTLATFIAEGHLARHVRRMRNVYGRRREVLLEALKRHGAGRFAVVPSSCGLHLTARLRGPLRAATLAQRAAGADIRIQTLDRLSMSQPAPNALAFGFGMIPEEQIGAGIARLCALLD